jgi:hypothetical protein
MAAVTASRTASRRCRRVVAAATAAVLAVLVAGNETSRVATAPVHRATALIAILTTVAAVVWFASSAMHRTAVLLRARGTRLPSRRRRTGSAATAAGLTAGCCHNAHDSRHAGAGPAGITVTAGRGNCRHRQGDTRRDPDRSRLRSGRLATGRQRLRRSPRERQRRLESGRGGVSLGAVALPSRDGRAGPGGPQWLAPRAGHRDRRHSSSVGVRQHDCGDHCLRPAVPAVLLAVHAGHTGCAQVCGEDGLEIAAPRHDAVVVPYDIVSRARIRRKWPVTMLDLFVDDTDSPLVVGIDRDGRRPLRRRIGGQVRFSMPNAELTATPSELRDRLHRRSLHQ